MANTCTLKAEEVITRHLRIWQEKPALRLVYNEDIFKRIKGYMLPGKTLEVGAGAGFFKKNHKDLIASDIVPMEHLDLVCDSHSLPFDGSSLMNIVGVDLLHHLRQPSLFFDECKRVLSLNGRLILSEPWISPISRFVYRYLHREECRYVESPLDGPFDGAKDPWDGNSMIPNQIFGSSGLGNFRSRWPDLNLLVCEPTSALAYPSTGGFQRYGVRSERIAKFLLRLETRLRVILMPLSAFRVLLVIERSN